MIFVTVLTPLPNGRSGKVRMMLHIFNLLVGIVVVGWSFFFGFGVLIFAGFHTVLLLPFVFVLFWSLSDWIQLKMILIHMVVSFTFRFCTRALPIIIYCQY